MALVGRGTTVVDLQGKTLIPGIIDVHAHMDREGLKGILPSLEDARSIADIQELIRSEVERKRPGEWVVTMPVGDPPNYADATATLAEGRYPTRWDLDQAAPDNPVYIKGTWTPWNVPPSVSVANSMALRLAGVDRNTSGPNTSVTIEKSADREPTGIFFDDNLYPTVEFTLMRVVPRFEHAQRVKALRESMRMYNAVGTTGTYEGHGVAPEVLRAYKEVWDTGEMTVRSHLTLSPAWESLAQAERDVELWAHTASGQGFGDDMLKLTGVYLQSGGSEYVARARSAELPYTGWAGFAQTHYPPELFRQLVGLAAKHNLRVNSLIRDVLEDVLDVFEEVNRESAIRGRRWVLDHLTQATTEQLRRIERLGLLVETILLTELWLRESAYLDDTAVADTVVAHKRYIDEGIRFGFGTDNKPYSPWATFWSAVARTERRTGAVLGPDQRLTHVEALRAFTVGGAYFCFDEDRRGSLEPGKLADLAVLSDDLLDMPQEALPELRSLLTMVGGRIVHRDEGE